jgi:NAD+ diphosphatase
MINEIAPHIFNNEISKRDIRNEDILLYFKGGQVLLKGKGEKLEFPKASDIKELKYVNKKTEYLFSIDEIGFFLLREEKIEENENLNFYDTQIFRTFMPEWMAFAGITGNQIYRWLENNKYCGRCGSEMTKSENERAMVCGECGKIVYPTISPAVTVAITNGDKILLARNAQGKFRRFALVAGFVEIGESFEETVKREVMEEVGLKVKNIRYYKSQPWAFSDTEMIGFFVDLDGDDKVTVQESEIAEARWFSRDELKDDLSQISLSYEMIETFRLNKHI